MIIYISGTGNSRYAAGLLHKNLGEDLYFLPDTDLEKIDLSREKKLIFVFPIYSWGVPPIVLKYIEGLSQETCTKLKNLKIYMVCTCGDETALAPEMLVECLAEKELSLSGGWSVIMPNDYVLLPGFNVDNKDLEMEKLDKVPDRIKKISRSILEDKTEYDYSRGSIPYLKTKLIYPLFKKWGIFPSKWNWTQECISCGKCVKACPVKNISFKGNHPLWGKHCISCLGCYHICPVHAIEYGKSTRHKGQYYCRRKP